MPAKVAISGGFFAGKNNKSPIIEQLEYRKKQLQVQQVSDEILRMKEKQRQKDEEERERIGEGLDEHGDENARQRDVDEGVDAAPAIRQASAANYAE